MHEVARLPSQPSCKLSIDYIKMLSFKSLMCGSNSLSLSLSVTIFRRCEGLGMGVGVGVWEVEVKGFGC